MNSDGTGARAGRMCRRRGWYWLGRQCRPDRCTRKHLIQRTGRDYDGRRGQESSRPPHSTPALGGREVSGKLGSFCWTSDRAAVCADMHGIPVPSEQQRLTVSSGSEMLFHYGGGRSPKTVQAKAHPLKKKGSPRHPLNVHGSGVERTIPAEMPSGEYAVEADVSEQRGDAPYYFRVMVK